MPAWRKSSLSFCNSNCTLVSMPGWRTSSASANGSCVEAAACKCAEHAVLVRDSKDPDGPVLAFTQDEWRAFTAGVRLGEFDLAE